MHDALMVDAECNRPGQGVRRPRTRSLIGVAFMEESRRGQTPQLSHKLAYVRAACRQLCYCCCCTPADLTLPWTCQECKDHTHRTDARTPCRSCQIQLLHHWSARLGCKHRSRVHRFFSPLVEWNDDRIRTVTFHNPFHRPSDSWKAVIRELKIATRSRVTTKKKA